MNFRVIAWCWILIGASSLPLLHASAAPAEPFHVVHYRLDLSFAMTSKDMGGTMTMTAVARQPLDSLVLNALALTIDSIRVNGAGKPFVLSPSDETLIIRSTPATPGDTLSIEVRYHRDPAVHRQSDRMGYYFYLDEDLGLPASLGYTMAEPSDARAWMPCCDDPARKATVEVFATVPKGFVAASNGRLLGTTAGSDSTVTWHWQEQHEVAPYLIAVTISKWSVSTLPFVRGQNDTVPVQYYVWNMDSANCALFLPTVVQMVGNLGALFGPYPFDKYGMTAVTPFGYGGMEHQTITTLARSVETDEDVVVHELAHQWWGDLVTCATWKDVWLNEGFASYAEALWHESVGGKTALQNYMTYQHTKFQMGSWVGAIYNPEGQGFPLFSSSVYNKAAWVLHMLRGIVGDSLFFRSLHAYRDHYAGGAATTDNFASIVDSVTGRDLGAFFGEWIYGPGWPEYAIAWNPRADTTTITISQRQDSTWGTFWMPLSIRLLGAARDTTVQVIDSLPTHVFRLPLGFRPDSLILDPDHWVLKKIVSTTVTNVAASPDLPSRFALMQNHPNPFNPSTVIRYQTAVAGRVRVRVYDLLGRMVATLVDQVEQAGDHSVRFDAAALASGVYVYQLESGGHTAARKMALIR